MLTFVTNKKIWYLPMIWFVCRKFCCSKIVTCARKKIYFKTEINLTGPSFKLESIGVVQLFTILSEMQLSFEHCFIDDVKDKLLLLASILANLAPLKSYS